MAAPRPPQRTGGEPEQDELVWTAVSDLVISIEHLEQEYEAVKLERKLREYFKKAAKNLDFWRKPWADVVGDYADAVYEMVFQGLGGRPWLMQGEADFLLVLDAGIKEHFPPALLTAVPRSAFEQTVLTANDRAFEEQRYLLLLDEVVRRVVDGQKSRKKLNTAGEAGRKEAAEYGVDPNGSDEIEEFVVRWIDKTVARLSKECSGDPCWVMTEEMAVQFFTDLMEADAVPVALTKAHAPPREGWSFVPLAVSRAYAANGSSQEAGPCAAQAGAAAEGAAGRKAKRKAADAWPAEGCWGAYPEGPPPPPASAPALAKCARQGCPFRAHSNPNSYARERGWEVYCCNACVESGSHGPRCERVTFGAAAAW
mmetsp:Transcript_80301/g.236206  ORF Transcript_80301/g.236206 Transcript_80301/m.236206 type:complete len:369 (-) Transcript_80301:67-1173(-)